MSLFLEKYIQTPYSVQVYNNPGIHLDTVAVK